MEFDIVRQLGAVNREVTGREHDGKPARVVAVSQTYSTSAEDLWEAITTAERLPRWFSPVSGDFRVGGRFQIQGNASGNVLVCDPPKHLKITWEYGGEVSWVEVRITPEAPGSAQLTLEHIAYENDHWRQFGPGATGVGWDLAVMGLNRHVETGAGKIAADGMAWMMSDEGKSFMRQCSEAWCQAAIAGGADPQAAKAAADRTAAAYTGA